jgi:hypothetical protein
MQKLILVLLLSLSTSFAHADQIITKDGQKLTATFMMPTGTPKAAVLILQGSGNVDLDGEVSGPFLGNPYLGQSGKLSLQLAEHLAAQGMATLRFSKRGVEDAIQLPNQKFPFLVDDAKSAFQLMVEKFPSLKHGVIGFSEGAMVASLMSDEMAVDGLFLLAPLTRPIDSVFGYQFIEWPTKLVMDHMAAISVNEEFKLPFLGASLKALDSNKDGKISTQDELMPAYQNYYFAVRGLLGTPALSGWYESLKALPSFAEIGAKMKSPAVFVYQGMEDAQMNWLWALEDAHVYPVKPTLHFYLGVGHCFSPMDGLMGEVKTSGPYASEMLDQLGKDIVETLK